jgi:hypothetical protein
MAGRATTPQGRKLGNINNMPNRRYLPSINFSVPFARWSHFYVSIDWTIPKSKIFKFLKRDCGTIPVAQIISGKIEIFSKHQRFLTATESSKYLLIFVLYVCVILCEFGTAVSKSYACFCCLFKIIISGLLW